MQIISNKYENLEEILKKEKTSKLFIVCDSFIKDSFIFDYLKKIYVETVIFDKFSPNPLYEDIIEGVNLFNSTNCDFILAIGGGSAIDVAKTIKLFSSLDSKKNYLEQEYVDNNIPFLVIPTTAGTGSESTKYAVIYYNGIKQSISTENIIPKYVILEPKFLETLPLYQKKSTMLDALCQAIESYWSVNSNEESKKYSIKAIELILNNMDNYLYNNKSLNEMMLASNYSGRAINITQTTAAHAMSYKITSMYKISHGHAVAICLPYVYDYMINNMDKLIDKRGLEYFKKVVNEISGLFGCINYNDFKSKFLDIYNNLKLETPTIKSVEELNELVLSVNTTRLKNNPVKLDQDALNKIYMKCLTLSKQEI